jgi:hypothetical protein
MELIGARSHRVIEVTAPDLSVLGSEIAGLHCDFLDRVDAGLLLRLRNLVSIGNVLAFDTVGRCISQARR